MITIVEDGYYVGIWFLAGDGQDWMGVMCRDADTKDLVLHYRFRYYDDPGEVDGFDPFDAKDHKSGYTAVMTGKSEDEAIAITDGLIDKLVKDNYCGTRLPWKVRGLRHKHLVRGDGKKFRHVLMGLPYVHMKFENTNKEL